MKIQQNSVVGLTYELKVSKEEDGIESAPFSVEIRDEEDPFNKNDPLSSKQLLHDSALLSYDPITEGLSGTRTQPARTSMIDRKM